MATPELLRKMLDSAASRKGLPGAGSRVMAAMEERSKSRTDGEQALREAQDLLITAIEQFEERAQAQEEKHEAEMMDALAKHEAEEQASEAAHAKMMTEMQAKCSAAEARLLVEVEARAKAEGALAGSQEACRVAEEACKAERAARTEAEKTFATLIAASNESVIEPEGNHVIEPEYPKGGGRAIRYHVKRS